MRYRKLNETDLRIYDFIVVFVKAHLFHPTIREISHGVGLRSSSTIHRHLRKLEANRKIDIDEEGRIKLIGYIVVDQQELMEWKLQEQKKETSEKIKIL